MWQLENRTPFAAERDWVRDENGAENWLVVVKATFTIRSNHLIEIAKNQSDICHTPLYSGRPGFSSLLYDSDLAFQKSTTDVLVRGHAYTSAASVQRRTTVSLQVGPIRKTLHISGDRHWERGLMGIKPSQPLEFSRLPLVYERAFGGSRAAEQEDSSELFDIRNPAGTGFAKNQSQLVKMALPNVEYPNELLTSWQQKPRPAGFLPVAPNWSPRVQFAGTYDAAWERERQPLPPRDFDQRFFQSAPTDQQSPTHLQGGEPVELINLSPNGPLQFSLPRLLLKFTTLFGNSSVEHGAKLQTVILEPDVSQLILVWLAQLPCHDRVYKLKQTTVSLLKLE